jgi:UDP:flavonoid glycosyltransferase YjiC (YdhE family)
MINAFCLAAWHRATTKAMKVLITSQAALGHFHTLAALGASLVEGGHEVLFAAAPRFCDRIRASGFDARPAGIDWSSQDLSETWPEFREVPLTARNAWINQNLWADRIPRAMLPDVLGIAECWRPAVILSGRAEIAGSSAGELLGIPYATASAGRVIALTDFVAEMRSGRDRFRMDLGLPPDPDGTRLFQYLYLNFIPSSFLPADPKPWPTRHHFRPVTFDGERKERVPSWIGRLPPRSVIYVSFGANQGSQLFRVFEIVIEAVKCCGLNVIVTVGDGGLPNELRQPFPNVHVFRYIPQRFIIERAAVVVCHGGINTVLGALTHRVPLLVIPTEQSDQSWNAERCESLGLGIALDPAAICAESVRAAVDRVLNDERYRKATQQFGKSLDRLLPVQRGAEMIVRLAQDAIPQLGGN